MVLNLIQIGSRIKAIRKRRGISQMTLAEIVDCSPTHISYIESGSKGMSLELFVSIANALNASADELLIDNLDNTIKASNHEFADVLQDCTEYEKRILLEMATATKSSLRANRCYLSLRRR